MKKNILIKAMGMMMVCAMVVGNTGIVAHATDDGAYHGNGLANGGSSPSDGSDDIGGGNFDSGNSGSSSSENGSSNSGSSYYDDGAYHGNGLENGGSSPSDGSDNIGSSASSYSAPAGLATKGNTAAIPGCETFRQIYKPADGKASIYHKGIEQYTAQLKDADGNAVAYKYASPYKDETTGLWYLNIVTADGVDTTGYTVGTYKGSVTYLPKLGMNGVMLNQVLVADATVTAE